MHLPSGTRRDTIPFVPKPMGVLGRFAKDPGFARRVGPKEKNDEGDS